MQCSDIKSEVAYKVGKRDPLERKDMPATAVKMHIDVAEIMKQNDRYDTEQEQQETPEQTALPGITEEPETGDLQEKHEAKEEDEEENALSTVLDFLSTFIVTLIVLIAAILVIGQLAGFHLFSVESGSMTPTYPVNSLVIVREVEPQMIEVGDVITFVANEDGMLVTHRVISVDPSDKTFRTRGDANNVDNPYINAGESLTLSNGTIKWKSTPAQIGIGMKSGSKVTLKNIKTNMNGKSIFINQGTDVADLDIIDSEIETTCFYVVSTNASDNTTGKSVDINIQNSKLKTSDSNKDNAGILLNVPGTLNIENSTIQGDRQAVIVRCGTATINDSKLICTAEADKNIWAKYDNASWSQGNEVPVATLVVGNRSDASAYPYDASCTLSNTTLTLGDGNTGRTLVYAAAYNGHTTTISGVDAVQITQSKDATSTITIK